MTKIKIKKNSPLSIFHSQFQKGFTLLEILLVVTILLILAASSAAFYSSFLLQNAVSNTVDQLVGDFRKAQIYSMSGKQNGSWGVRYASNTLTLFLSGNSSFDETFTVNPNVTISGFSQQITFVKATGMPSTTSVITISGNNTSKTVTVNGQGIASR